ncbi:MAG TPA: phytanoyl-CoA dioxygenase family protein [Ilumatobacter sp.]
MDPTGRLLTTSEMATFVARGFLEYPGVVPADLNAAAIDECDRILATWGTPERPFAPNSGDPWTQLYPAPSALGAVLRRPEVTRIVDSLVGPDARFDHDFVHLRPPHDPTLQRLHADAVIDPNTAFDIQIFYFPHEVRPGGGGTGFVPGTHLRRVHETQVGRYRHVRGERQWEGPAGSVLVFHHGLWHRGMPNPGHERRLMYKIRLNPTRPQVRLWDTGDLEAALNRPDDHIFARFDPAGIGMTLRTREAWMGEQDHRLELIARARLWRYLTGSADYDLDWYHTRVEGRAALAGGGP